MQSDSTFDSFDVLSTFLKLRYIYLNIKILQKGHLQNNGSGNIGTRFSLRGLWCDRVEKKTELVYLYMLMSFSVEKFCRRTDRWTFAKLLSLCFLIRKMMDHPLYSADLASNHIFLLLHIKKRMRGQRFSESYSQVWCKRKQKNKKIFGTENHLYGYFYKHIVVTNRELKSFWNPSTIDATAHLQRPKFNQF